MAARRGEAENPFCGVRTADARRKPAGFGQIDRGGPTRRCPCRLPSRICGGKYIYLYGSARTDCHSWSPPHGSLTRLLNVDKLVQVQRHVSQIAQRRACGAIATTVLGCRAFRLLLEKRQ